MTDPIHPHHELNERQLQYVLDELIERLVKHLPKYSKEILENKEQIAQELASGLKDKSIKLDDLGKVGFLNRLALVLVTSVVVGKNEELKKGLEKLRLIDGVNEFLKDKKPEEITLDDLKNVLKNLKSNDLEKLQKELKNLEPEFQKCQDEIQDILKDDLQKLPKPTPGETKSLEEKGEKEEKVEGSFTARELALINLFGVLNVGMAGGLAAVVTVFTGNPGIPDQNPHHGGSLIDLANKVDDSQGDPLGFEALAITNYLQAGDTDLVNDMHGLLNRPKPTPT